MEQKFNFRRVALNTHKVTIIHIRLRFSDGSSYDIEPLKDEVGGIIFSPKGLNENFNIQESSDNKITLLNENGEKTIEIDKKEITEIEPLVIYPDGSIWSGIVGDDYSNLQVMFWSDNLIHTAKKESYINDYYNNKVWWKVPSSLLVYSNDKMLIPCYRIEHTCGKDCK